MSWRRRSNASAAGESGGRRCELEIRGVMASGENGSSVSEFGGSGWETQI